jgi:hypothetical protein
MVKDPKKFSLPFYDPAKTPWYKFSMKLRAALIDYNMDYYSLSQPQLSTMQSILRSLWRSLIKNFKEAPSHYSHP